MELTEVSRQMLEAIFAEAGITFSPNVRNISDLKGGEVAPWLSSRPGSGVVTFHYYSREGKHAIRLLMEDDDYQRLLCWLKKEEYVKPPRPASRKPEQAIFLEDPAAAKQEAITLLERHQGMTATIRATVRSGAATPSVLEDHLAREKELEARVRSFE